MKAHKQTKPSLIGKEFPLLPWKRQWAIMEHFLHGTVGGREKFYKEMSRAERSFFFAIMDVLDAYGPRPEARYQEIIRLKSISARMSGHR